MEFKELLEAVEIEGASEGDVVFITTPADMKSNDFVSFSSALRSHVDRDRADGKFFPRCIVMPPGINVEVARAHLHDRIEIVGNNAIAGDVLAASPDAGFPHG